MNIAFDTLGCKLNQAETDSLARQFTNAGHRLVSSAEKADIYILNTCTVTNTADAKSRHLLRMAHRRNPNTLLVVTGCYAQRAPEELTRIEGVELITDNDNKAGLLRVLEESGHLDNPSTNRTGCNGIEPPPSRTRASIKIQDGCNNLCTYCIVPLVRGSEKSIPSNEVITEINNLITNGIKEIVLTGTEIGSYNDYGIRLADLLERIMAETAATRIRLSSLQSREISKGFIGLWHDQRLCPHFHLSLQSGSDTVLKRMKRNYSTADYRAAISLIRSQVPDVAITTDIITGFPGETTGEFEESYDFCRRMEFARIHVFPYSPRPGTEASRMPDQISDKVKKQRNKRLLALAGESALSFNCQFSGRTTAVLLEHQTDNIWTGHTGNYIKVYIKSNDDLTNKLLPAKLLGVRRDGVWGEVTQVSYN